LKGKRKIPEAISANPYLLPNSYYTGLAASRAQQ